MSTLLTPLDLRLPARFAAVTLEEAQEVVDAARTAGQPLDVPLRPVATTLVGVATSLEEFWRRTVENLESAGAWTPALQVTARSTRETLDRMHDLAVLLRENTQSYQASVHQAAEILARIDAALKPIEELLARPEPPPNLEAIDRGLAEMERGEGEDAEAVLQRFLQTGRLEP
jgi:hypothetical protein